MRKETWSVGFACLLGAFIGTLVALEIAARFTYGSWFWSIGALFGGLVAYCVVDFQHFCAGVVRSYRNTIAWRPNLLYWKAFFFLWCGIATIFFTTTVFIALPSVVNATSNYIFFETLTAFLVFSQALAFMLSMLLVSIYDSDDCPKAAIELGCNVMKYANPVSSVYWTFWCVLWIIRQIPSACARIPPLAKFCWITLRQLAVRTFFYVHSERRKICFVDAALGATAGYFLGSTIAGAVIGAILGIVNYEIISIRWLKIVPAKAK